ncbi:MAG: hypothetical protein MUF49_21930 [Oculatellaceae cyanobacterium Prado106]|nr:hypothetical protein [Oculatellaceae cyanobacterium Prado106]
MGSTSIPGVWASSCHLFIHGLQQGASYLLPGLLLGLVGCSSVSTVQDVQKHPHRNWFNSTVYLQGTVRDRAPLLDAQVYQLEDATGAIWVLTPNTTRPQVGDRISIKGQVQYESIPVGGLELGEAYIKEQEQLEPESKTPSSRP